MTRDEFFNKLEAGAKWDVGVAIARTNPLPLDANSVFKSLDDLTAYATSNPLAYPGQVVSVLGETEIAAYLIKTTGDGAAISKLAASSATGDISADVEALKTQVANIINGTQVVGAATKATQDGEGNVIKDTYVSNGSLATTLTQTLADYAKLDGAAFTGPVTVQAPTAEANPATKKYVDDAIAGLDVEEVAVGVGETIKTISETDGKIAVVKQSIQITQAQVTGLDTAFAGKQDKLSDTQLSAVNSGITAAKVATYDGYADGKQDKLTETQLNAVNSGITAAKVTKYDGYEATINGKQDAINTGNKLSATLIDGLATVATSGSYNDLTDKPVIPNAANNAALKDTSGATIFTADASEDVTITVIDCGNASATW